MSDMIPSAGVHCIGNGLAAAYIDGADILQLFGPCYSMPCVMSMTLPEEYRQSISAQTARMVGSATYITKLFEQDTLVGEMCDYTSPCQPIFLRMLSLTKPLTFKLHTAFSAKDISAVYQKTDGVNDVTPPASRPPKAVLIEIPQGSVIFAKCKTDKEAFCQLLFSHDCDLTLDTVTFPAGESLFAFVAGAFGESGHESFAQCMETAKQLWNTSPEDILKTHITDWQEKLADIHKHPLLPDSFPGAEELTESVALSLMTQTSAEGGVLAGLFYHLAYGRDMYGVFRGYLALGLYDYARTMVEYMTAVYRQKGSMPNASGMGMTCAHCHENDDVEQTGYYLLELVAYVQATQDIQFLKERMDYALFLLEVQEKHLVDGMIPFNGDETYIAGGLFPRSGIDHGSMEATSLYVGSALGFLQLAETHGILDDTYIQTHRETAHAAWALFSKNFLEGERVLINQPDRVSKARPPMYRHGVCHGCNLMTWLTRTHEGGYLCASCYGKTRVEVTQEQFSLDCALWMTVFAECSLLPQDMIRDALQRAIQTARSGDFGRQSSENTVGYEYGVMLYAAARLDLPHELHEDCQQMLQALLKGRVEGSVWSEYYRYGKASPASCPYRPWESAINLIGISTYVHYVNERKSQS